MGLACRPSCAQVRISNSSSPVPKEVGHERLALVHGADHAQLGQPGVGQFAIHQGLGDNADHLATAGEHRVGEHAHQSNVSATEDQSQPAPCHPRAQLASARGVLVPPADAGAAEDTQALHIS